MVKEPTSNPAAGGHGRGTTLWRGLVATLVLLGAAFAQTRSPCFATVVGPDGKPIVGAEVTCAFSPDPVQPWRADVVRATTDARGRAKCDLLVGRPYVAWAIGPAGGSGFRWSSQPLPLVGAGRVFDLRAEDECASRQVPVASLAPWREAGAAGLRWFPVQGLHVFVDLPLPAGDTVELPPSLQTTGCLAVHDAKGEVLVATTVAEGASAEKAFGAPVAVAMQVVDTAGAPVAGATIEYEVPSGLSTSMFTARYRGLTTRCVGTTDDAGKLQGYVTKAPGSWGILVTAGKPGWSCDHAAVEGAGNIRFTLGKAPPVAVRVVGQFTSKKRLFQELGEIAAQAYGLSGAVAIDGLQERETLGHLVNGLSYKMVAAEMGVGINTVRTHVTGVYAKLQVHSVSEAVVKAIREQIV